MVENQPGTGAMHDRFVLLVASAANFLVFLSAAAASSNGCRCTAGASCFPSSREWDLFNATIGGALLLVRPPASPCYGSLPNAASAARCAAAQSNWYDSLWRSTQPGAAQHPNWEDYDTETCLLPPGSAVRYPPSLCQQGSVPVLAVNVSSVRQVQDTILFARERFLRIVVKSSGHDYLGRSFARGSISLWMHNLKSIQFVDEFLEQGCDHGSTTSAVAVGAGVQLRELYTAADARGKLVVGGLAAGVAASGGYVQGGGHSPLSQAYGLAVDNVLQFTVVTPDGTARYANRCINRDLFWALRGGGGGTFGVVITAVYRTHPAPWNVLSTMHVIAASGTESYRQLMAEFTQFSTALYSQGWAGYFVMSGNAIVLRYAILNRTSTFHNETFGPFLQWIAQHDTIRAVSGDVRSYSTFLEWYRDTMCSFYPDGACNDDVGHKRVLISRLVPVSAVERSGTAISDALITLLRSNATSNSILGIAVTGGAAAAVAPGDAAVNPALRTALWHITAQSIWNDSFHPYPSGPSSSSPIGTAVHERMVRLSQANAELRELTPGSGAYFNEADYYEPGWQRALFGDNYQRLLDIKSQVDPHGLLVCWHCVGSERWSTDLNCPA